LLEKILKNSSKSYNIVAGITVYNSNFNPILNNDHLNHSKEGYHGHT
jgi:hypothetical protein